MAAAAAAAGVAADAMLAFAKRLRVLAKTYTVGSLVLSPFLFQCDHDSLLVSCRIGYSLLENIQSPYAPTRVRVFPFLLATGGNAIMGVSDSKS